MKAIIKSILAIMMIAALVSLNACNNNKNKETMTTENNTSIFPKGEKLSNDYFTGNAFLKPVLARDKNNDFVIGSVTFEPGARTQWHKHPKGQVLMVTDGYGFYQEKGKPAQSLKKGDVVNIPENVEHWHGATATVHLFILPSLIIKEKKM